jgi:8-oxo-dGTP diphosphatase
MVLGVNVAVMREGKILLTRREDYAVWCLPGGHWDDGESLAQAAIREVREETGYAVRLDRLVGLYSRPGWVDRYLIATFAGQIVGGTPRPQPDEVTEMAFFGPGEIPEELVLGVRQRIEDAFAGYGGSVVRAERAAWPFEERLDRLDMYRLRDESGLQREQWYRQTVGYLDDAGSDLEVG